MKKSIPLEVSSTLGRIATDKPLEISPYANATGVTTEKAPVLIAVRSAATVTAEEFATRMVKAGGQGTEAQARLALNAVAAVLGELVGEYGAVTVNTPFGTIQTFIAGTLENAQDTPDPETNRAFLGVVVPEAYRRQFAQMSAYVPADACPAALKRVRDKATNAKGIRGTDPFYLEGRGMTIGGEGETLELLDAATREKLCDIAVDAESKSPVQFLCTLAPQTALEAGTYLLRLVTLAGGEAGSALWPLELKVELLEAVEPPEPEPIAQTPDGQVKVMSATDGGQSATFTWGHEWKIGGINMFSSEHAGVDWTLSEVALYDAGSTGIVMYGAYSDDGTEITVRKAGGMSDPEPGTYNATIGIMATKTGETQPIGLDIPITLVVEE